MMRKLKYQILFGIFALIGVSPLTANCGYNCDPCYSVLDPCGWSIMIKGGVAPSHYTARGPVWLTVPAFTPAVFTVSNTAHFHNQFETPWEVGGEIAWNASSHVQFFLEGIYQRGKGKTYSFTAGAFEVTEVNSDYKTWGGYLGSRYYLCQMCSCFLPFIGFKAGILHQAEVDYDLSLFGVEIQKAPYYLSQWVPSIGGQIGFDYRFACNWSIVFTAEAVITQGLKNNRNNVIANPVLTGGLTNVNIGETGKVVSYPITLGLKYNF